MPPPPSLNLRHMDAGYDDSVEEDKTTPVVSNHTLVSYHITYKKGEVFSNCTSKRFLAAHFLLHGYTFVPKWVDVG